MKGVQSPDLLALREKPPQREACRERLIYSWMNVELLVAVAEEALLLLC